MRLVSACPLVWLVFVGFLTPPLSPPLAAAQVAGAEMTGVVTDQAGAAVPGAAVTVTNDATNQQRVALSTADGFRRRSSAGSTAA